MTEENKVVRVYDHGVLIGFVVQLSAHKYAAYDMDNNKVGRQQDTAEAAESVLRYNLDIVRSIR